jgi:eukaryotic-like serine/threonine-protein kinase
VTVVDRALAYRVFSEALDIAPPERGAFLQEHYRAAPALQAVVERLLQIAGAEGAATGILGAQLLPAAKDRTGCQYGPFRLLERLGVGGMGTVYRAERINDVPQVVAVKILRDELSAASSSRFLREARLLARLEHPSIARLIDVGVEDGEGWIAMEFVRGKPITDFCRTLPIAARVEILLAVADAVATAHRMLVVHRDIKPSNVLVTEDGTPKLIDFGIASALGPAGAGQEITADVRSLFTPHYAAPEQVRGEAVTVATDVFGLGALAYRVLSGCEPFAQAESVFGYMLAVTQEDVACPSEAAATTSPSAARRLRGDLDSILTKALAREPAKRYAGVHELQADLRAYLEGRPVEARRPSWTYRVGKFARRHTIALSASTALLAALVAAAAIYVTQEQRIAQAQSAAARRGEFLEGLLKSADPYNGRRDITVASLLDRVNSQLDRQFSAEPLTEASMLELVARTNMDLGRFPEGHRANDRELDILRSQGVRGPQLGKALLLRGQLFRFESQWERSAAALREAVTQLQDSGDEADLCAALDNLGVAQAQSQQLALGESTFLREIAIEKRAGAALDAQRMQADYSMMGLLGPELGHYDESERYAAEAWQLAQKLLPPDNPDWLEMEDGYAVAVRDTGHPQQAEPIFRDALARSIRVLGPHHHDTLVTALGLGNDLIDLHRDAEAAQLALDAGRTLDATLGSDNWYGQVAWEEYGLASCNSGNGTDGLSALQRVEAERRRLLPATHRLIYSTEVDIGLCLTRLRRFTEAEPILLDAASGLEKIRGADYRRTQQAYAALRDLYAAASKPDESRLWAARLRIRAAPAPAPGRSSFHPTVRLD